ncbi:DUF6046 domain-containing protein [Mesonia sp.]|uniref:DUF6046 domain-containing protein n=1 Tax=Mesonia sp. TaxID=1960830 RepID=UPI00175509BA|nr:DUF6046 domain-containing protein [Mesonia sp.]HIB37982.1 hypothetical protein [Mesonia sp.]
MEMNYNISQLFAESFGLKVNQGYSPEIVSGKANDPKGIYEGISFTDDLQQSEKMSHLGTPVLFPITFSAGSYKKYDESGRIVSSNLSDFTLPYSCVIDFNRPKIISKTNMSNGYGTVKEIFGFDDWQIDIKGFFLPQPNHPQGLISPYDQENMMNSWDELACSIAVENKLFTNREIASITIEDFKVGSQRGRPNVRPFTIRATSNDPIELEISLL